MIADRSYREIARVRAGNGLEGDLHDMELTPRGTALITDLRSGRASTSRSSAPPPGGQAMDSVIQEIDVALRRACCGSGAASTTSRSAESTSVPPKTTRCPYDYFHINSIEEDTDGDLLVSARNTWAIYKIDQRPGRRRLAARRAPQRLRARRGRPLRLAA